MINPNNRHFTQQWHLKIIQAPEAWQLLNGGNKPFQTSIKYCKRKKSKIFTLTISNLANNYKFFSIFCPLVFLK